MGQAVGRLSGTWDALSEEKDRVIHWSGEVLSKVADNIRAEATFQMDYDNAKLDAKVETWMQKARQRFNELLSQYQDTSEELRAKLSSELEKLGCEFQGKMRKDYTKAYGDIKKFTRKVDELGLEQRKIHEAIQQLRSNCANDIKKFQKKFTDLRAKTFDNLKAGEKLILEDKKLKTEFEKRVYDIDHKNASEYEKKVAKLLKDFEKSASK